MPDSASVTPHDDVATHDVLVIGGGPAGSTIAALLAERGRSVVLLDKDKHPRFHIGESLLPFNVPLFERLGVREEIEKIGMPKFGIEFVSPHHDTPTRIAFADGWHKDKISSFQVRRSAFDHILLKNAAAKGAKTLESCRVTDIAFPPAGGVVATSVAEDGTHQQWRARFLVDATGRDTFLATKLKLKQRNRRHESAAIFGHFTNAKRLEGQAEGHISIIWFDKGWFWFIPLSDGTTSVGAVCRPDAIKDRGTDITSYYQKLIASSPVLAERLKDATLTGPATATGNYSYTTDSAVGDRYLMVGDASGFIDPVFSTGVFLAMHGSFLGADAVEACLDHPERMFETLQQFDRDLKRGLRRFSWFIYRITRPAIRSLFMMPSNVWRIEEAVLALLAGDVGAQSPIRFRLLMFKVIYYAKTLRLKLLAPFSQAAAAALRLGG